MSAISDFIQLCIDNGTDIPSGEYLVDRPLVLRGSLVGRGYVKIGASVGLASLLTIESGLISNVTLDGSLCSSVAVNIGNVTGLVIKNCKFFGCLPKTQYLIDLSGGVSDVIISGCEFSNAYQGVRLRWGVNRARVSNCVFTEWRNYGIIVRGGLDIGPQYVAIENNVFSNPAIGAGSPRQMIVAYGATESETSDPPSNIIGLRILNNECRGVGEPHSLVNSTNPTTRASGDQISVHCCTDFQVIGNESLDGGEIGISVTRNNRSGIVANNLCAGNDAHGMQISRLGDRSSDILVTGNRLEDNSVRRDGSVDSMAGLFIQDGERITIQNNLITDTRINRLTKYGIRFGSSVDCRGSCNKVEFNDPVGAVLISVSENSSGINVTL